MAQLQATKKPLSAPFIKKIQAVSQCSYIRVSKNVPEKCLPKNAQTALFSSVRSQIITGICPKIAIFGPKTSQKAP